MKEDLKEPRNGIKKKKILRQRNKTESAAAIKTGNIDAFVVAGKNKVKIYAEKTADETYRTLIEKMHEGAVTLNDAGAILYCNSFFAKMVNLPMQKVIGTKLKKYIDTASVDVFDDLCNKDWNLNSQNEIYLLTHGETAKPVLMSVSIFLLNKKKVLSIILTDLTVQKRNQEELNLRSNQLELKNNELEHANKDLTTFTYIASHDLQEPMRKIQNFVTLISNAEIEVLSERSKDYFRRLGEAAKRMHALIVDLATYSGAKNADRNFEKTKLSTLLADVTKDLDEVIKEKKATIEVSDLCEVKVIHFQFRQLMTNLILNSLKFSKPDVALHIDIKSEIADGTKLAINKLQPDTDYCHITYSDNGIGFEPQYNELIFEVFKRLHSREEYKGTGMGLAICKRIIENHNGVITATGELNVGARFDIYIPAK